MRDDPSASRNGTVWVSSLETTVVGRDTSSNGNFEIRSRIAALDIVMTFFTAGGTLGTVCGGGVVKRWCSIRECYARRSLDGGKVCGFCKIVAGTTKFRHYFD